MYMSMFRKKMDLDELFQLYEDIATGTHPFLNLVV